MKTRLILLFIFLSHLATGQVTPSADWDTLLRRTTGKGLSQNDYSNSEKDLLRAKPDTNQIRLIAPVRSVNGKFGVVVLSKADIGLGNVPNTDATKAANIIQTASLQFVSDIEKATWNSVGTAKANLTGTNSFFGKNTFGGSFDASSGSGYDISALDFAADFQARASAEPYRFFAARFMPTLIAPGGGLPSSGRAFSMYAKGTVLLGGSIEPDSSLQYDIGTTTNKIGTIYAGALNTGSISVSGAFATASIKTAYYTPLTRYETNFLSNAGLRIGTVHDNGFYNFGPSNTLPSYRVNVEGDVNATGALRSVNVITSGTTTHNDAVTINKSASGSSLVINAGPGSGGGTFGLHINGSTGSQSGGIKFNQTSSTGVNVMQFSNTSGLIAQWWNGSSGDAYAPNALGLQAVKGNLDIGLYESGKSFRIGTAIGMTTPPFIVEPVNGNVTAGSVKVATGGYSGIGPGNSTTAPAGTLVFSGGHALMSDGSNWKQLDN